MPLKCCPRCGCYEFVWFTGTRYSSPTPFSYLDSYLSKDPRCKRCDQSLIELAKGDDAALTLGFVAGLPAIRTEDGTVIHFAWDAAFKHAIAQIFEDGEYKTSVHLPSAKTAGHFKQLYQLLGGTLPQ